MHRRRPRRACRASVRIALAALPFLPAARASAQPPAVRIDAGAVEGARADGVVAFKGIPYAAPPVGDLRWRPPRPVPPWSGTRRATEFAHDCMQLPVPSDAAPLGTDPDEDCLYLNVWAPDSAARASRLPVLVWIHGGGFVNGGSSAAIYDGSAFARQGIVVVSINYRLGRFGFFAHPALSAEGERPLGNYGYLDQLAALRWVQRNIAAFGGDPGRVTIAGESAGGQSVLDLVASAPAEALFHRAVVMSGGGRWFLGGFPLRGGTRRNPPGERIGENFAREMGIRGDDARALQRLRALPADRVRGRANMVALLATTVVPLGPLQYARGPIVDGEIVRDTTGRLLARGRAAPVPLLIGTVTQDLGVWLPTSKQAVWEWFGPDAGAARRLYDPDDRLEPLALAATVGADQTMHEPARFVARTMAAAGNPVWLYRFGYVAESKRATSAGAGHASELPFLFNTLDAGLGRAKTPRDEEAARAFHGYVANFVMHGDPNGARLPAWPRVEPSSSSLMLFTSDRGPVALDDPWRERLDVVQRTAETRDPPVTVAELARGDWSGFVAVGAFNAPRYPGSDESRLVMFPLAEVQYRQRLFASIGTVGLAGAVGAHLVRGRTWTLSAHTGVTDRRPVSRGDALDGLDDRGLGVSVGGSLRRTSGLFSQTLTVSQGVNYDAGTTAKLVAGLGVPLGFRGAVSVSAGATVADARQMRFNFGTGLGVLPAYDADAGLESVEARASLLWLLGGRWVLAASGGTSYLGAEPAESPLVRRRNQPTIGVGIGYRY